LMQYIFFLHFHREIKEKQFLNLNQNIFFFNQ
jgi:hypothetical protein